MIFSKKQFILGIAIFIFNNISFGQRQTFKCVALYNETHKPLNNVQMQLICKRASYKGVDYDTIRSVTDENGYAVFDKVIRPGATQFILYCADKNYTMKDKNKKNIEDAMILFEKVMKASVQDKPLPKPKRKTTKKTTKKD